MLFRDPPEHTRLRGLVNKAFTPKVVEGLRPHMQRLVDGLLDAAASRGEMDVIAELAFPLPVTVIAVMLGVPEEDHRRFNAWSRELTLTLEPVIPADHLLRAGRAAEEIIDYFRHLVARKRQRPGDDLLTALIHAEEQGRRLDTEEMLANAVLLLVAGHETTVNLIGNGALALLHHPEALARLGREPGLIESAVEEVLRYDSPVQITSRLVREDTTVGGQPVQRGTEVLMLLGSANRDEARFAQPDRLDLARPDNKHLSFGGGAHYCLGAPLARVEGQLALGALARRFPKLRLAGEPARRPSAVLRGLTRLPIKFA
jgi:cytochrome P450